MTPAQPGGGNRKGLLSPIARNADSGIIPSGCIKAGRNLHPVNDARPTIELEGDRFSAGGNAYGSDLEVGVLGGTAGYSHAREKPDQQT